MSTNTSNDRSSLCAFTFSDSRQCRMPRRVGHPYLCAFHARKEAQALDGETAGRDIAYHLSGNYLSACDLTSALGRLFSAVAQGQLKPKTASTLAYLGQTLAQPCISPKANTSTPTAPTSGAKPFAPRLNSQPTTCRPTPIQQLQPPNPLQPLAKAH